MRIIFLLLIFIPFATLGQNTKQSINLKKLKQENDSLKVNFNRLSNDLKSVKESLQKQQKLHDTLKQSYNLFIKNFINSSSISKNATFFFLIGSIFEIIGAILLAGADLSNEIKPIRSIHLKYTSGDLSIKDELKEDLLTFLGTLGILSLFIGFFFQIVGAIILLSFTRYVILLAIVAILLICGLLIFLSRLNLKQPLNEKAKIFFYNLKRILVFPIKQRFASKKKVVCDVCQNLMFYQQSEIWYKQGTNTNDFPYLYPPYGFYLGHAGCLQTIYLENEIMPLEYMTPDTIYKISAKDFYDNHLDDLYNWNETRLKELKRKRNSDENIIEETGVVLNYLKDLLKEKTD